MWQSDYKWSTGIPYTHIAEEGDFLKTKFVTVNIKELYRRIAEKHTCRGVYISYNIIDEELTLTGITSAFERAVMVEEMEEFGYLCEADIGKLVQPKHFYELTKKGFQLLV